MKRILLLSLLILSIYKVTAQNSTTAQNIVVVTMDGYRWQELFKGIDPKIVKNQKFTKQPDIINSLYGGNEQESRARLMPFFWNVIAKEGQLFGNRELGNKVNVANFFGFSYPGYNEMFTGKPSLSVNSNKAEKNKKRNVFEVIKQLPAYKNQIVVFSSWKVIPYVLRHESNENIFYNGGYQNMPEDSTNGVITSLNYLQEEVLTEKHQTRNDQLTFIAAKEYLATHKPKVLVLSLGETDEYAHSKNYDMYLRKAAETDRIISELWYWLQTTEGYKDNTTMIITTDHGRGSGNQWPGHGFLPLGSKHVWMAFLGKHVQPKGEIETNEKYYLKQIAPTIALLAGIKFGNNEPMIYITDDDNESINYFEDNAPEASTAIKN